jgi:hypothetical protein
MNCISARDNSTRRLLDLIHAPSDFEPGSGFGRFDMATFYARDDTRNQHHDRDAAYAVAFTIDKTPVGLGGSFAWSQWGIVVSQSPNTVL